MKNGMFLMVILVLFAFFSCETRPAAEESGPVFELTIDKTFEDSIKDGRVFVM